MKREQQFAKAILISCAALSSLLLVLYLFGWTPIYKQPVQTRFMRDCPCCHLMKSPDEFRGRVCDPCSDEDDE